MSEMGEMGEMYPRKPGVANAVLCEELYALSGWRRSPFEGQRTPEYDVAYLIAMLPAHTLSKAGDETYTATWRDYSRSGQCIEAWSRTNPANAIARLAISLFQAGVLLISEVITADQTT